jgi:uncharacterized integral membrane protein (TIGR00698 family)
MLCLALLGPLIWLGNPALALLVGGALALIWDRRLVAASTPLARYSLQAAIVLLGLKLDLHTLWQLSAQYTALVAGYVLLTLAAGLALGRLLAVEPASSKLMSAGTAICGGTAIATLSAVVRAEPHQTGVALAIVFLLNVVALLTFPLIGRALDLSEVEFGLWSALAIHDTSSVVATAAIYGDRALEVATTIKLGRTLWLIPLVFAASLLEQRGAAAADGPPPRVRVPWFVVLFVAAAACGSLLGLPAGAAGAAGEASRTLLVVALFLVGTELTRSTVRRIRGRVLWQALGLWLAVVPATLAAVVWLA